ncbi:MAG: hypothetical protein H5T34_06805 [Candidatus Methanomethyliales bacterium]|nr:hypothetical protein [Candidatus Methanomethylicales archaeon]
MGGEEQTGPQRKAAANQFCLGGIKIPEEEGGWRAEPLDLIILDLVRRRDGAIRDDELLEMLRTMIKDISLPELNRVLMRLELRGKVNVSAQKKGKVITLAKVRET